MIEEMNYPEGATPLSTEEMEGLKLAHVTTQRELNHLEQANIEMGLLWLNRQRTPEILTDHFVRKLHKNLFGDVWQWAGSYRWTEKNIGVDPMQISAQVRNLMGNAQYWVENNTYEPVEAAVRFHHKLVYIHPFPNGNGRHARILADTLMKNAYKREPINWSGDYKLQQMSRERRKQYIAALMAADGKDYKLLFDFVGYG
jgi:Fic-DOC domain mobile mystery protein B